MTKHSKAIWEYLNGDRGLPQVGDVVRYQGRPYRIVCFRTQPPMKGGAGEYPDPADETPIAVVIEPVDGPGDKVTIFCSKLADIGLRARVELVEG